MTSDSDPKQLPEGEKHLIEAHTGTEPTSERMQANQPYFIAAESEPIHYQEELAELYGYEFDAVALAEIELASDEVVPEAMRERLLLCQDPENHNAYGLLEIGSDNTITGEYPLPQAVEGQTVEVFLGRSVDAEMKKELRGLEKLTLSARHVKITIAQEGVTFTDLGENTGTSLTYNTESQHDGIDDDTVPRAVIEQALQEVGDLSDDPAVSRDEYLAQGSIGDPDKAVSRDEFLASGSNERAEEIEDTELETQLESDPEAILRDHFDALLDGKTEIEGVDPEVAHMVSSELKQLVNMWRELSTEEELAQISANISEVIRGIVAEGAPLLEVSRNVQQLYGVLVDFISTAEQLRVSLAEGDFEYISSQASRFQQAREALESQFGAPYFQKLEEVRTSMSRMYEAVEEEISASRRKKADLQAVEPNFEEREQLKQLGSVQAIRDAISTSRPGVNKLNMQRQEYEHIARLGLNVANMGDVVKAYELVKRGLDNAASVQPGRLQDRAEVLETNVIRQAHELQREVENIAQLLSRVKVQAELT